MCPIIIFKCFLSIKNFKGGYPMNVFNKIGVVVILIFLACLSIISMVNIFAGYFKWSDLALRIFTPEYNISKFVVFLALLGIFAISVLLMLLEFYRKRTKVANISSFKTGNAMVTLETIAGQIKNEVIKIDGLEELKVKKKEIEKKPVKTKPEEAEDISETSDDNSS